MQSGDEIIERTFSTRKEAFGFMIFISSFDVLEVLLRREGNSWTVKYRETRSVIYLKEEDFSLVG